MAMTGRHPFGRLRRLGAWQLLTGVFLWVLMPANAVSGLTLHELESDPRMTPKSFANRFEDFAYEYCPYVQPPDVFLRDRAGDCDDYAILADHILGGRGYHTRIIHISLTGSDIGHAVCYVDQDRVYLDYNNRAVFFNLTRCGASLREIATKVARSFERNWTSASEYSYSYKDDRKRLRMTVVKTDDPSRDPDRQSAGS
jgi:hypothetical protein